MKLSVYNSRIYFNKVAETETLIGGKHKVQSKQALIFRACFFKRLNWLLQTTWHGRNSANIF